MCIIFFYFFLQTRELLAGILQLTSHIIKNKVVKFVLLLGFFWCTYYLFLCVLFELGACTDIRIGGGGGGGIA